MKPSNRACTLIIKGLVQGVGYRASTQQQARRLLLLGWVSNEDNGDVRIQVEGPRERIEQLIQWCRQGPAAARVNDIDINWQAATGNYPAFTTRYSIDHADNDSPST